ncbi:MAG: beta strand repeat-containing protein [Planctomycetaceae bacterium]
MILGDLDTTVFVYPGNSVIDTTLGLSGTNSSPAGANITIGGNLEGTSGVGSKNIEFIAGTAGDVRIVGNAGGLQRLGIVLVTNANDVTVNNVTADRFLQRTGTGTTTTNGTIDTNGSETFSVTNFQPDNVAATGGTLNRTFGVNIVTTQIVINSEVITASGGVHLSATDGTNVGVVTLNNNGRIRSDLDVILQGEATIGIVINALGTARFGAPGSGDELTGTQRDFVTTSGAPVEFRSNINMVASPTRYADRFIVSTSGGFGVPAVVTSATAPILFAGTVDANYSDLDLTSGTSNINFRGAVSEVQRLFLRLNDTSTSAPAVTTTTVTFAQNLSVEWLKPTAGHYNVDILGTTTLLSVGDIDFYLPNDTVFLNTGRTTLGNDTADSVSVMYGLDTTASSHTVMAGTIVSRERMDLSPIVLTAGQTTTIYTSSWFDVSVEAVTAGQNNAVVAVGASVTTAAGSSLVLGHANSSTNFTFAGDVTVPQLNTTLPAGDTRWNLFILGSLVITGGGITTLNNRGHFQIGSSGGNNSHAITGGLNTSTCLNTTVAGNLSATDALTLTGGVLRILVNSPAPRRISTTTGTITLPYMVLADGVDLTVGSSVAVPIVTGAIEGTWGGADSDIRFESTGNVTVNGRLGYDIGDVQVIGAATASFNGGLGLPYWNPVSTVTITQSTTTTFPGGIFAESIQAASTAGNLIFTSGARLNGPAVSNISTSGTVTFGDAPAAGSSPDELAFAGGLTTSLSTPVTINGDLRSFGADLTINGALTVSGNSRIISGAGTITLSTVSIATNTSLSVGTESSGAVLIEAVGATVSTGTALRLGSTGTTTVGSAVSGIAQLQVDGGSTTFSGAVGTIATPIPSVILVAGAGTTTFGDNFFATTVSAAGGPGAISFNGTTSTITNAATFSNSGTLSLGNAAGDTITFTAGLTAGTTAVNGTLQTTSAPIALGSLVSTSAIVTTGLNSASTINIGAVSGSAPTLTAGTITLTGSVSATGTISLNSAGNVTLSGGLSSAGSLVVTSSGTTTIAGGSATAVTVSSASIQLTKTPLSVTNATSLAGTSAVTLQSGSGINDASTSNSGTITISAGAGGFSQAANAAIYTRNTSGSAIQITTSGGGNAAIGTLFAAPATGNPVSATTVTVTATGAVTDSNDPVTGSPVNNVRAGSFVVTGSSVGTATNPIEYYTTAAPVTTGKFLVSTAPNGAAGWLRRYDFSRSSSLVMGGTTGVYSISIFNASTAASSSNGTHFGFASGQSIAIYDAASTSRSSYQFYIDSLIHNSRVVTFYVDTNTAAANVDYYVRVYFGSGTVATNSMVTAPGSTTSLASATGLGIGVFSRSAVFSRKTDANGTISMEFKRPIGVTTGNWGVVGVEVAAVEAELTSLTELPQMLEGVSFDANGLTDETAAAIASNGFQGRLLDEASVMAARDQAIADWAAVGISPEQLQILQNTPVIIGDLSQTGQVGLARADHIVLDDDAMGLGWFVGGTDKEVPAGMMDLLTVMTHELGHRLGYEDLDASANNGHIMAGVLRPGERRQAITARTMVPQQPVSVPSAEITAVTPEKTADLFAANDADVSGVASRISPPIETSTAEHFTSAKSIDGRPQQPAPVRLLLETESASSDSSSQLSLLDDLFADVITTLDALNQGSAGN